MSCCEQQRMTGNNPNMERLKDRTGVGVWVRLLCVCCVVCATRVVVVDTTVPHEPSACRDDNDSLTLTLSCFEDGSLVLDRLFAPIVVD